MLSPPRSWNMLDNLQCFHCRREKALIQAWWSSKKKWQIGVIPAPSSGPQRREERHSASGATGELQIKTTMKCHLHSCENGPHPELHQRQAQAKVWSRRNSHWLLVGTQNGTAPLEDSLAGFYKAKQTLTTRSSSHVPRCLPKWTEHLRSHENLQYIFIAALFIVAKTFKQPKYPSVGMDK